MDSTRQDALHTDPADRLQRAQNAYSASTTWFNSSVRREFENDYRQFNSQHPMGSKYIAETSTPRSKIFRPKTRATIRKNEAIWAEAAFSTGDVVTCEPENASDKNQLAAAEFMQGLLQYRLSKTIPWFLISSGAYQDAQKVGTVISYVDWRFNPRKGVDEPQVMLIPPENFLFDPASDWFDVVGTSPYLCHLVPMYVKDVRQRMESGEWIHADDATITSAVIPYDSLRQARNWNRIDPQKQAAAITDYTIVWVHRYVMDDQGADVVFHTLGNQHMLEDPKPIEQVYLHGKRPFVLGMCALETHKLYSAGVAKLTREMQSEINNLANGRLDSIELALSPKVLVKRNKQVDTLSLMRRGPSVTQLDDMDDVRELAFNDVTGSAFNEQDRLNGDFDDIAGSFSGSSVAANRRMNETVGGMNIMRSESSQVGAYQMLTFVKSWVEPVLRLLVALESHYETDEKLLALVMHNINEGGKYGNLLVDDLLSQDVNIKINIGMGSNSPTEKAQRFMQGLQGLQALLADGALERYGMDVSEVIKELFGNLGYADGSRFFDQHEDPRIKALQNQLQEAQQAAKSKVSPEMLSKQIEKLDAEIKEITAKTVKTGVDAAFAAMQAGQVVASMPGIAPVGDKILEAMGYVHPVPQGENPHLPEIQNPELVQQAGQTPMQQNTHPEYPANPEAGEYAGIEGGNG